MLGAGRRFIGDATKMSTEIDSIAVIGAGTMGSGIALVAATSGIDVHQIDLSPDQLERARSYHDKVLSATSRRSG